MKNSILIVIIFISSFSGTSKSANVNPVLEVSNRVKKKAIKLDTKVKKLEVEIDKRLLSLDTIDYYF